MDPMPRRFAPLPNRNDHHCFGCGPLNPSGLRMQFFSDDVTVRSRLTVPDHLGGWDTLVHGGVIATIMDEIMSWAAIYLLKRIILTKSMTVDFITPIRIGEPLQAEGRVLEKANDKEAVMVGTLINDAGRICAKSRGTFALLRPDVAKRMKIMDDAALEGFAPLLKSD